MSPLPTTRYVSSNEPDERKVPLIRGGFEPKHLRSGDVAMYWKTHSVGIEAKKVYQLAADLQSGQLQKQARMMAEDYTHPILCIEGGISFIDGKLLVNGSPKGPAREEFWKAMETVQDLGLRLQPGIKNVDDYIDRVFVLMDYYGKDVHQSAQRKLSGDPRLRALMEVDGLGVEKAKAVLEAGLECPYHIKDGDVKGVGPKLAERVRRFWLP